MADQNQGAAQWMRKVSLIVGTEDAIDLSDLRFTFRVKRGDLQTPNSARIRVYNVAPDTAHRIQKEFTRVVLQAGYQGNYGIIFDGTIVQVRRGRESKTDTYLDITAADGDSAYNFAIVNTTLAAGSTLADQVNAACTAMNPYGVTQGYTPELPANSLPRGKVMFGMARDIMRGVSRTAQAVWSIQDGKVVMVPETAYMPGDIPEITSATGMVGLPEQTSNGITVKMLLNPSIKVCSLIHINNASVQQFERSLDVKQQVANENAVQQNKLDYDGHYYVMLAEHWGDTRGNDWYTGVTCLATDATVLGTFLARGAVPDASAIIIRKDL